ncbi:hypothetical protein [Pseudopedobacter saltans]|nr:hypothetical protein [Pseudopedobacter saltans]
MKKSLKRIGVVASAIAATLLATPKTQATTTHQVQEQKAARLDNRTKKTVHVENHRSGLDLVTHYPKVGLSPKEYGMRFGNGKSRKGKTNFKRLSHQYKVRRR